MTVSKPAALARVATVYAVALAVAAGWLVWGPSTDRLWLDTLIADVIATLVVFGASRLHRNSSFYDAYWSVAPPVMLAYWSIEGTDGGLREWLLMVIVLVWAIRLTANWVYAWPGLHHEDWRYVLLKRGGGRREISTDLVAIHLVPTGQVFLAMTPAYVVATRPDHSTGWLDVLACLVGLAAVGLELTADLQMHRFARERRPGQIMDRGLWGWSRHPNYVGEVGFWFAIALFGLAASPDDWWWLFAGTVAMLAMFLLASIPMMERRSLERRPGYQDVLDRVPRFLPRPTSKAASR